MSTEIRDALAPFDRSAVWLNTDPLTADDLRGHVVLVDFWTYSCVNWLRTLPYVRAWSDRYADRGLVVVGAHAPEFSFEHDLGNVRDAIGALDVGYPVIIDNDFGVWRAFDNHYWPAVYLVDQSGRVRFRHFGEEAYAETEQAIQQLLGVEEELSQVDAGGIAQAADWGNLGSPETYVGRARGGRRSESPPGDLELNQWTLSDGWSVEDESAVLGRAGGSIAFRFDGRDVNLVMSGGGRFTVTLDGEAPGADAGLDVDAAGEGTLTTPRMYQLVRQGTSRGRTVEVTFDEPAARIYVFTFG